MHFRGHESRWWVTIYYLLWLYYLFVLFLKYLSVAPKILWFRLFGCAPRFRYDNGAHTWGTTVMGSRTGHVTIFVFNINGKHAPLLGLPIGKRNSLARVWLWRCVSMLAPRRASERACSGDNVARFSPRVYVRAISRHLASIPFISRRLAPMMSVGLTQNLVIGELNLLAVDPTIHVGFSLRMITHPPLLWLIRCCLAVIAIHEIGTQERERKATGGKRSRLLWEWASKYCEYSTISRRLSTEFSDRLTRSYCFELYSGQTTIPSTRHSRKFLEE